MESFLLVVVAFLVLIVARLHKRIQKLEQKLL
jgi:predicted Holliday junction resolvase-like endonuclease